MALFRMLPRNLLEDEFHSHLLRPGLSKRHPETRQGSAGAVYSLVTYRLELAKTHMGRRPRGLLK